MAVNLVLLSHGAQNGNSPPSNNNHNGSSPQSTPKSMTISDMSSQPPPTNPPDFLNQRRRERFVFRPNHLEILEKNFQEDSYPSFEKREEMARACNQATESLSKLHNIFHHCQCFNRKGFFICQPLINYLFAIYFSWSAAWRQRSGYSSDCV